ncbi:O-antigen/teichoic acid export membrane protein [Neobacillus bataviensis]|uniref:O-antigen/teichoic acid export membrane protein n=1 Tax=Neobacillus bataviensis TaxID=220685 RepID=A0A561D229_9BACI|nr:sugar isomerase [Neobacillus bataviensis]TWD97410.1 O-antigen/teichoic acid export membrane protein [Neobacillus bataviensis]
MKAKRSFLNLLVGLGSQIITIVLGIFIPRLILVHFGSEVNGLLTSITQIIVYFTLLEAGVGAASLQALYKPVANGEKNSINEILAATSSYYKKTGIFYFFAVIALAVIYPLVINSSINKVTIMVVILFTGLGGAVNYYYQGKYRILLTAEGKSYIVTSITTIITIVSNLAKIVLLYLGYDIIIVQASFFIITLVQVIVYHLYISRNYKWIDLSVNPNFGSISQKNSVLVHQFSSLIFNNTDVLILTIFTNLKVVSVYVMFNMLFSIIDNLVTTVSGSITFVLGQTFHDSKEKFLKLFDAYEVYFMALVFSLFTVTYILVLPFMRLYTAGIHDINYIDKWLPILFVSIKLLVYARSSCNNVINIAGHFKKTQYRSIFESAINLVGSLLFVNLFGIYGVLLGTLLAVLYRSTDIVIYANKTILGRSPWRTAKRWLFNAILFLIIIFITHSMKINPTSYLTVFVYAVVLTIILSFIYFFTNSLLERETYLYSKNFVSTFLHKRKYKLQNQ